MSFWLGPAVALALAATPELPALRLKLEPALLCGLNEKLEGALTQQQLRLDDSGWTLEVRNEAQGLRLRLINTQGTVRGDRLLKPTPEDCTVLPRTAALMVRSWLGTQLATSEIDAGVPLPVEIAKPLPPPRMLLHLPEPTTPPPSPPRPPPIAEPEKLPPVPPVPPAELSVPPAAEFFSAGPGQFSRRSPRSFSVMVSGGGATGVDDSPAALEGLGTLSIEWGFFEPWAVSLDAGLQTSRTQTVSSGSASVTLQWATLALRRGFFTTGIEGFHLLLGVEAIRLSAAATGFSTANNRDVFIPAGVLAIDWRLASAGGLFLFARLAAQARYGPQGFNVVGLPGDVLRVGVFGLSLELGAGWNFF